MPFTQFSRRFSALTSCALLVLGLPAIAENAKQSLEDAVGRREKLVAHLPATTRVDADIQGVPELLHKTGLPSSLDTVVDEEPPIILAQAASCATCGTSLDPLLLMDAGSKKKDKSLLTDSLWGNLILEMAYQRDKGLQKLARRMNIVNYGTMASIGAIAGGTLAQGIVALGTLNPPEGHLDSYSPGIIGTTLSTATILTFVARMYFNHHMQKAVEDRQIAIRTKVEGVLNHLERSDAKCVDAHKELTELIGERACKEWVQLWQSSHQLAMTQPPPRITLNAVGATVAASSATPATEAGK